MSAPTSQWLSDWWEVMLFYLCWGVKTHWSDHGTQHRPFINFPLTTEHLTVLPAFSQAFNPLLQCKDIPLQNSIHPVDSEICLFQRRTRHGLCPSSHTQLPLQEIFWQLKNHWDSLKSQESNPEMIGWERDSRVPTFHHWFNFVFS